MWYQDAEIELLRPSRRTPDQGFQQHIVIVHGFLGPKYIYYRNTLEGWALKQARKLTSPAGLYTLRFDASAIPARGRTVLEDAVWKLRSFLLRLLPTDSDPVGENTQGPGQETDSSSVGSRSSSGVYPSSKRRITFVAHGLGSWIAKDVLAHPRMDSIAYAYRRTDMILLDVSINKRTDGAYRIYLERNWTTFGIRLRKPKTGFILDPLVSHLREIDENYDTFASTHNSAINDYSVNKGTPRHSTIYQDPNHPIWMSEDHSIELNQSEQAWNLQPVSRLITGAHVPVTCAPMIGEFPSSLEANSLLQVAHRPRENDRLLQISPPAHISISQTSPLSPTAEVRLPASPPLETFLMVPGRATVTGTEHLTSGLFPSARAQAPTMAHQVSKNHDTISVVSTPDFTTMSSRHLRSACVLANTFLQMGELENAYILFEKVLLACGHARSSAKGVNSDRIWILMQLSAVRIYRGFYHSAMAELGHIEESLESLETTKEKIKDSDNLMYHCRRWMATCQFYSGRWQQAVSQMQTLLEKSPDRPHLRLHRDQALAYAYLGQYEKARSCLESAKERASTIKESVLSQIKTTMADQGCGSSSESHGGQAVVKTRQEKEHQVKENSLKVAHACIDLLAGDYLMALNASSEALRYMKTTVGSKHFRTLATATLKAWSLAYNDRYNEAETLCLATWKATKAALGRNHPQTLEAIACLIHLYRCQGRFAEAVGTGMSATSTSLHGNGNVSEDMRDHPQHISVEFQLAQSLMAYGDYVNSKAAFSILVPRAEHTLGETHPESLRYKAEQARVLLRLGCIQEARDLGTCTATQQFQLYNENLVLNSSMITESCDLLLSGGTAHATRLSQLADLLEKVLAKPDLSKVLHPFLLSTLQLTAEIEIRQYQLSGDNEPEMAAAQRILESLHNYQFQKGQPGSSKKSLRSASIALDLGTLCKEQPENLSQAVRHYAYAYQARQEILDENHLSTLVAQRDLIIAQTLHSSTTSPDSLAYFQQVKKVSDCLCMKLESRLGPLHQDTLTSRLWCYTLELLFSPPSENESILADASRASQAGNDGAGIETSTGSGSKMTRNSENTGDKNNENRWREIHESLIDPMVVGQRMVESLAMRRQLAGLLIGVGRTKEALIVVERAMEDTKKTKATMTLADSREGQGSEVGRVKEPREGEREEGLRTTLTKLDESFKTIKGNCTDERRVEQT